MVNRFYYIILQFKIVTSHLPPPLLPGLTSGEHKYCLLPPPDVSALGCRDNYYLQHQLGWRGINAPCNKLLVLVPVLELVLVLELVRGQM